MSKIDDLLAKYCPSGVETLELKDVCTFRRGKSITKQDVVAGDIPVIAGGKTPAYYHNCPNREGETVAVAASGAAGFVSYWNVPVFLSDSFSVSPKVVNLLPKYVFYFLKNLQHVFREMKIGGGVPHVYARDLKKIKIPIPPLKIQKEIVRILDNFTEFETELETELEARKKQYEYYRNILLSFADLEEEK